MFRQSIDPRGGFPPKGGGAKPKSGKRKKVGKLKKRKKTKDPFSRERKAEQAFKFGERRYGQSGRSVYDPASLIRFHQSAQFNQARDTADAKRGGGTFTGTSIGEEKRVKEAQEADILFKKQEAESKSRFVGALETLVDRTKPKERQSKGDFDTLLQSQGTTFAVAGTPTPLTVGAGATPPPLTIKQKDKVRRRFGPETTIEEIPEQISFNRPTETPPVAFQPLSSGTKQRTGQELQDLAIKTREEKLKVSQGKGGYRQGRLPEDRISRQVSQADKDADAQKTADRRRGFVGSGTSGGGSALLRPRPSPSNPSPSIFALQRQESVGDEIKGKSILRPEPKPSPFQQPQVGLQKQISGLDLSAEQDKEEDIPDLKDPSPSEVPFQAKAFPKPEREPAPQVPLPQPPTIPVDKKKKKPKKKPKKPKPEPEPEPVAPPAPRIEEITEPEPEPAPAPKPKKPKEKPKEPEGQGFRVRRAEPETPVFEVSAYGQLLQEDGVIASGSVRDGWAPTPYVLYDNYVMKSKGKTFSIVDVENEDLNGWNSIAKTRLDKLIKEGKIILR